LGGFELGKEGLQGSLMMKVRVTGKGIKVTEVWVREYSLGDEGLGIKSDLDLQLLSKR
jgi:hypothetical protein